MAWDLQDVRSALVITYAAVGYGSMLVQSVRRFGSGGLLALAPLLASGVAIAATRHAVSPFPLDAFLGVGGALSLAVVLVTRGRVERFVDPTALPVRLRTGTENDAMLVQTKAIGLWLLLSVPLFAVLTVD